MRGAGIVVLTSTFVLLAGAWASAQQPAKPGAAPAQATVQDEDPQAKSIREQYEAQLRRERRLVTISMRNVTPQEIIQEFRIQTEWNFVFDPRNFPEDYRVEEFVLKNVQARKALEEFARVIEATLEFVTPSLVRVSRPPRLTFNFRDADIRVVIDMIARVSGANIIIAPQVQGSISLSINNVPWNEVLDAVVRTLGFTTVKENFGIIRVIHPDELLQQLETRVFKVRFLQPPPTYNAAVEPNKQINGQAIRPPTSIEEILRRFTLKTVLETVLSKNAAGRAVGRLDFDPQTSSFIVQDTKNALDKIAEIIELLDVEPEQVYLDLKFISTTNEDLLTFGTTWAVGPDPGAGIQTSVLRPSTFTAPDGSPVTGKITKLPFGLGREVGTPGDQFFLTSYDMIMAFRAFKQDRFTRLIQEPTLLVMDNTEAVIFVGEDISYAETRTELTQFGGVTFTVGEAANSPVKVGFQLFIIPKIVAESNKVILTVIPQNEFLTGVSATATVAGFERFTVPTDQGPQTIDLPRIANTTLVSRLIVESGRTVIVGGLVQERTSLEDGGIPVLKDLPLINYLFKQRADSVRKEHLLIFITPRIVRRGTRPSESLQELLQLREEAERAEFRKNAGQDK